MKEETNKSTPLEEQVMILRKEVAELETKTNYERALDRERLSVFYDYMDIKKTGRRDYDWEASKLKREVLKRTQGMDYRDVRNFLNFKENKEAYRAIDRAGEKFPLDIQIKTIKNSNRSKKIICKR